MSGSEQKPSQEAMDAAQRFLEWYGAMSGVGTVQLTREIDRAISAALAHAKLDVLAMQDGSLVRDLREELAKERERAKGLVNYVDRQSCRCRYEADGVVDGVFIKCKRCEALAAYTEQKP